MTQKKYEIVILADGDFPTHPIALERLKRANFLVACDGAAKNLIDSGYNVGHIIGDMDTLSLTEQQKFSTIIEKIEEQESNDLSKAFHFVLKKLEEMNLNDRRISLSILGATGKREDHTIGNVSLLADYSKELLQYSSINEFKMFTDYGYFESHYLTSTNDFSNFQRDSDLNLQGESDLKVRIVNMKGRSISIFAFDPSIKIVSQGLEYPTDSVVFDRWWKATLNKVKEDNASLTLSKSGAVILYFPYE